MKKRVKYCAQCRMCEKLKEADYKVKGKIHEYWTGRKIPYQSYLCDGHLEILTQDGAELQVIEWVNDAEHEHAKNLIAENTGWQSLEQFLGSRPTLRKFKGHDWLQRYWNNYNTLGESMEICRD